MSETGDRAVGPGTQVHWTPSDEFPDPDGGRGRKPTVEEAEAILTLVRGGWLRLTLDLDAS